MLKLSEIVPTEEEISTLLSFYLEYTEKKCPSTFDDVVLVMFIAAGFQIRKTIEYLVEQLNDSQYSNMSNTDFAQELLEALEELKNNVRN